MISRVVNRPSGPIDGRMSSLQQARNPFALLALMLVAALMLPGARLPTTGESAPAIAFFNVNAIPMDSERVLENQTVLVVGDTIAAIGPAREIEVPTDARQIDGRGRLLIPGLTEMHGHVPEGKTSIWQRNALFLYLANGVTTVRNMKGEDGHLLLRDKIDKGEILGPKLYIASPWLGWDNAEKPDQARKSVREYKDKGYDLLKVGEFPGDAYFAMAETAKAVGIPFGGHVPLRVSVIEAIDAGQVSIDHFDRYVEHLASADRIGDRDHGLFGSGLVDLVDASRLDEAVSHTAWAGVWNVPTLSLAENIVTDIPAEEMAAWPEMTYAPE